MAATTFPFNLGSMSNLKNSSGNIPRFNMKNDGQYNIASGITVNGSYIVVQGYSSTIGDGGRGTIDGSTNAISIFTLGSAHQVVIDIIVQNNGTSGTNRGFVTANQAILSRCVANNIRGNGFHCAGAGTLVIECEAYSCNKSNTAGLGGFAASSSVTFINCIAHDNTGSGADGFTNIAVPTGENKFINCISDSNGRHGFTIGPTFGHVMLNCDVYSNGGDGFNNPNTTGDGQSIIRNCNFIKNTGWAINSTITTGRWTGTIDNCGFGAGTQANGSGTTNGIDMLFIAGSITYANNVTPWVDPANGDFRINLATAAGAGRGAFTQTQSSYGSASMLAYPDIGAVQHKDFQKSSVGGG